MDFSPEALRNHWKQTSAKAEAIEAQLNPLREELDKIVAGDVKLSIKAAREREAEIRPQIKALQEKLFPIEMERAAIARALGGKTGDPE